jgi:nucleoside-diphosphate-sugar epimerase
LKYFVTGATGFIGGRVARQLLAAGHSVIALARDPGKAADLATLGATIARGDVTDRSSMRAPMRGADGVFHLAGWYKVGTKDKRPGAAINIEGTRNVLEVMRELGIRKGVYTSTLAVNSDTHGKLVDESYRYDGPHLSEYDRTKWVAHYEVAEPMIAAGLPLVIVMPGLVYGPGDTSQMGVALMRYLKRTLPLTPQRTAFSWGHVDDIAHAHLLAMERGKPGESYIVAGPTHTFIDGLAIAERITGIRAPRWHPSPGMTRFIASMADVAGAVIPLPDLFAGESTRAIAGTTYIGDNARAKRELGYAPRALEAGLKETLDYDVARIQRKS